MHALPRLLAREQWAFLARTRAGWGAHLAQARDFLGRGLQRGGARGPVLVLGAGGGLELPWSLAPKDTVGWDADPFSRWITFARHRRLAPWVHEDLCGGLEALHALAARCARRPSGTGRRDPELARRRLAGLLPALHPEPEALRAWLAHHRPGVVLAANVLGQLGGVAERLLARGLGEDPGDAEDLQAALDDWTTRALRAVMDALLESGAELWLLHDRAVMDGAAGATLGPYTPRWTEQLRGPKELELMDPLCGLDLRALLEGRVMLHEARWMWPVGPGQLHLVEALACAGGS